MSDAPVTMSAWETMMAKMMDSMAKGDEVRLLSHDLMHIFRWRRKQLQRYDQQVDAVIDSVIGVERAT